MEQIKFIKFIRHQLLLILIAPTIFIAMITLAMQTETDVEFQKWNGLVFNSVLFVFCFAVLLINLIVGLRIYSKQFQFIHRGKIMTYPFISSKILAYIILAISSLFCGFVVSTLILPLIKEINVII